MLLDDELMTSSKMSSELNSKSPKYARNLAIPISFYYCTFADSLVYKSVKDLKLNIMLVQKVAQDFTLPI